MDISDVRKRNLRAIIRPEERGNVARFCRDHRLDETWIRQLFNTDKQLGEKAARNFEEQIGLKPMSLDNPKGADSLESKVSDLEKAIAEAGFLTDAQKTHLVGLVKTLAESNQ